MIHKYIKFALITLSLCFLAPVAAVSQTDEKPEKIYLIADGRADSIILRWAPSSLLIWQIANKYGYTVKRYTIMRDGKALNESEEKILASAIKPLPANEWDAEIAKNENAEIVKEMIYGEINAAPVSDWTSAMNMHSELNQRFGFAVFICDLHPNVAKAAALMYTDKDIKKNEHYIYRLSVENLPQGIEAIEEGGIAVSANEKFRTPFISGFMGRFKNQAVDLSWETASHIGFYTAYRLEKSLDSINFTAANNLPLVTTDDSDDMYFTDSIPENGVKWYYRVKGVTPFGTEGVPSLIISGRGRPDFKVLPVIDTAYETENGNVFLNWHFESDSGYVVKSINVYRSFLQEGPYQKINNIPFKPQVRAWTDSPTENSMYYKVEAVGENPLESAFSFSYPVIRNDSIAPLAPTGLFGLADTSGVVRLKWAHNTETDFLGYRLFRANSLNEEFREITSEIISDTVFTDTIFLKTTTPKIYYKAIALDVRYNPSDYSDVLEVNRPDTIPPLAPVITECGIKNNGIFMKWEYAQDTAEYFLYKLCKETSDEVLLHKWAGTGVNEYYDTTITDGYTYRFKITAQDISGNKSEVFSGYLSYETGIRKAITDIKTGVNKEKQSILLKWNYDLNADVDKYIIYRSFKDFPFVVYKSLSNDKTEFTDFDLQVSNTYFYKIKAIFKNGAESIMSKKTEVKY